jgi:hypothetical protein
MLKQIDIQLIESIIEQPEKEILKKSNLIKLQKIKVKTTGIIDKECFCASVRRKVWFKDFTQWYEAAIG